LILLLTLSGKAFATERYVDANSASPTPPYTNWATAAVTIQDAIEASFAGDLISVTNGIYSSGGKAMSGTLTNRAVLDKALTVQSVNGPGVTVIMGAGAHPGSFGVRCAWVTNGAVLSGFTLRGGATRANSGPAAELYGGGVWGVSTAARVTNCIITANAADANGGGASQITLLNCTITDNDAGGGFTGIG